MDGKVTTESLAQLQNFILTLSSLVHLSLSLDDDACIQLDDVLHKDGLNVSREGGHSGADQSLKDREGIIKVPSENTIATQPITSHICVRVMRTLSCAATEHLLTHSENSPTIHAAA